MAINDAPLNEAPINSAPASELPPEPSKPCEDGKSAYEVWLSAGNEGTVYDFLLDIKGEPGQPGEEGQPGEDGEPGADGKDNYQLWLEDGNTGSVQDFLNSQKGQDAKDNYQLWLEAGNTGSVQDFLNWNKQPHEGKKTTQLDNAGPLTGDEVVYLVQNNVSVKATLNELKAFLTAP